MRSITTKKLPIELQSSQYTNDVVLLTSSSIGYKVPQTFWFPFLVPASQEECLRSNAMFVSWESVPYSVLRLGDCIGLPALSLFLRIIIP